MGVQLLGEKYSQESVGVGETEKQPTLSYTEIFYQCLPHYLVMGMSADEFWNCDPRMYKVYREKDRLENERKNELLWIAGIYTARAISSCLATEEHPNPYPKEPFSLNGTKEEETEEQELTDKEIQKTPDFIRVMEWANKVNKQKRGENDGR